MNDRDEVVRRGLAALAEDPPRILEEFWLAVRALAQSTRNRGRATGIATTESPDDVAADFVVALATEAGSHGTIVTSAGLGRAYRRWLTQQQNREGRELWHVVSQALRDLEKEGFVERPPQQRAFYNSNRTEWALRDGLAHLGDLPDERAVKDAMPELCAKGGGDRVLKPAEGRAAAMAVLRLARGRLAMREIVGVLRSSLPMLSIRSMEEYRGADPDGGETDLLDITQADQIGPDAEAARESEVAYRSERIWAEAGEITRGKSDAITGQRVLCCYWIPARVVGEAVTLEQFGPTSTVMDVVTDLKAILARYVPRAEREASDPSARLACRDIAHGILAALAGLCSENGFCRSFYEAWSR